MATARPAVFISYSHLDEDWKDRLVSHLRVLEREGELDVWDDRRIGAGEDWRPEIEQAKYHLLSENGLQGRHAQVDVVPLISRHTDASILR